MFYIPIRSSEVFGFTLTSRTEDMLFRFVPSRRGGWCISKESCWDGEMWVSVLMLGAADHPVPVLPGPRSQCLSVADKMKPVTLYPLLKGCDFRPKVKCVENLWMKVCVCECVSFGWIPSVVSEALVHSGACGPMLWTGCLANGQSAAALCRTVVSGSQSEALTPWGI